MDLNSTTALLFIGGLSIVGFGLAGRRSHSQIIGGGFLMLAAALDVLRVPFALIASIGLATLGLDAAVRRRRKRAR